MTRDPVKLKANKARDYQRRRPYVLAKRREYVAKNKAKVNSESRDRSKRPEVKARRNKVQRKRYAADAGFRAYTLVRTRLLQLAKQKCNQRSALRTIKMLGCSALEFKLYIEKQFRRGMSWSNLGTVWHLDHKIPCKLFDLSDPAQVARCFNYRNYQPLEVLANLSKGAKLLGPEQIPLGL